ncbi:MAG: protoporphyrinogen oxidase [Planctomycetaceae bacterium]|nr:protoporphyrinogen oxidase [Planctomycetaceae bacterium]
MSVAKPRRVVVIGAGITGLAATHRVVELAESHPVEVTLVEASDRFGGIIQTESIDGFVTELGPDSFITNKPAGVRLCERLGFQDSLLDTDATYRRSLVLRNGNPTEVPDGFMLLSPAKVWPILKSPIFSIVGKLRMGSEYFLPPKRLRDEELDDWDESLADFVRRRFGTEALERIVQPMVGGIYTSDPEKLSLRATMARFWDLEQEHGSLIRGLRRQNKQKKAKEAASGARYGLFTTPKNGLRSIVDALVERIRGNVNLMASTKLIKVAKGAESETYSLHLVSDGKATEVNADEVIFALPAFRAADCLDDLCSELASDLRQIEYASSAVAVTTHRLQDVQHPMDAFGLVIPKIENRRILAVSFPSRKFPNRADDGCIQLRTFIGGALQPEVLEADDSEVLQIVIEELKSIFGVMATLHSTLSRHPQSMPQYHVGHLNRIRRIRELEANLQGIHLAGNAYDGVGIPDCIASGEAAAEAAMSVAK